MKNIIAALLLLAVAGTAKADYLVTNDYGGSIVQYVEKYNAIRQSQGRIVIDDFCISACTAVLGLVPLKDVCANPSGRFGFHSAFVQTFSGNVYSETGTKLMWSLYPESVRTRLTKEGWDGNEHPEVIFIPATDLVRPCNG